MNSMWTVVGFTIRNKFRSRAFLITSIIFVLLISLGANVPYFISLFNKDKAAEVGIIDNGSGIPAKLQQYFADQDKKDIMITIFKDQGSQAADEKLLKDQLASGTISGYLEQGADDASGFPVMTYKSVNSLEFSMLGKLQSALQQIKVAEVAGDLKLSGDQLAKILSPVTLEKVQVSTKAGAGDTGKSQAQIMMASGMVYVLIIMLFMAVMVSGQLIATEITAEKSSRVMEILVTSVSPLKQMFGKIIGMFIVGLTQILVLVAVAVINIKMPHNRQAFASLDIHWSDLDPKLLVYALIFYLAGYFLYATLFAAVGSIVSRTEDLGQAIMPITFLTMAGYFIAIFGIQNPTSPLITVTSFIPFFSPFIMFLRMGTTDPAAWQVWLSIAILLVSIFVLGWLSAKIYRTGVLMYGKKPSFKELRKAMKAYKI